MIEDMEEIQKEIDACKFKKELRADFECLTKSRTSKHILITISGYLSEKDVLEKSWKGVWDNHGENPVYGFRWGSAGMLDLPKVIGQTALNNLNIFKNPLHILLPDLVHFKNAMVIPNHFKHSI